MQQNTNRLRKNQRVICSSIVVPSNKIFKKTSGKKQQQKNKQEKIHKQTEKNTTKQTTKQNTPKTKLEKKRDLLLKSNRFWSHIDYRYSGMKSKGTNPWIYLLVLNSVIHQYWSQEMRKNGVEIFRLQFDVQNLYKVRPGFFFNDVLSYNYHSN